MGLDNDQVFNDLLDEEYKKIPIIFRLSRKAAKIALIVLGVFVAAAITFIVLFYDSGKYEQIQHGNSGYSMGVNIYNNNFMLYAIFCLIAVIAIAGWLTLAQLFEKRAFAKASHLSNMIHLAEMNRNERKWQEEKMKYRPSEPVESLPDDFWAVKK